MTGPNASKARERYDRYAATYDRQLKRAWSGDYH